MKNGLEATVEHEALNEGQLELISGGHPNPVIDTVLSTAYATACKGDNLEGACFNVFFANNPAPQSAGC